MTAKSLEKPHPRHQPAAQEINAYVEKGAGKDTEAQSSVLLSFQLSVKAEVSRLTVDLPKTTHRRFKIACAVAGTQMNEEIRQFIERRSRELEALGK